MAMLANQVPPTLFVGLHKGSLASKTQLRHLENGKPEAQRGKGICPKSHREPKWQSRDEDHASASQGWSPPRPNFLFSLTVPKLSLPHQHAHIPTTIPKLNLPLPPLFLCGNALCSGLHSFSTALPLQEACFGYQAKPMHPPTPMYTCPCPKHPRRSQDLTHSHTLTLPSVFPGMMMMSLLRDSQCLILPLPLLFSLLFWFKTQPLWVTMYSQNSPANEVREVHILDLSVLCVSAGPDFSRTSTFPVCVMGPSYPGLLGN